MQNSGSLGLSLDIDLDEMCDPAPWPQPGDTWYFQFWHRDGGSTGPVSNMTDALRVQFQ